jgi:hypothetical protein
MRKIHVLLLLGVEAVLLCAGVAVASRNSSGTMSAINGPYVAGTVISSSVINARLADIETELSDSKSRSGKGDFSAPVRAADGTVASPAWSWTSETGSGLYRIGSSDIGFAIAGTKKLELTATAFTITPNTTVSGTLAVTSTTALSDTLSVAKSGTAAANAATFFEASLANGNSLALRLGKADTGASDGVGIYYTANATAANSKGCVAVSGQTDTLCVDGNGKTTFSTGVGADGSGFKHKRFGASCTTGVGVGQSCQGTYTWTTAFADANYTVVCTGEGQASGVPVSAGVMTKTASNFVFVVMDASGVNAAQFSAVDCIAVHD